MSKAYFTFCYNGVPVGRRSAFTGVDLGEDFIDYTHKYAFVVGTLEPNAAFAQLAQEPLFHRLLGHVLYGWQAYDTEQFVISSKPDMLPELLQADNKGLLHVCTKTGKIFKLPIRKLDRTCISALKYGLGCNGCPLYEPMLPGNCYLRQIVKYTRKLGQQARLFVPAERAPADDLEPGELNAFIQHAIKKTYKLSNGYHYVSPVMAREDSITPKQKRGSIPLLRYYDTCCVNTEEMNMGHRLASDRAITAAETRRLEKDCRENCVFAPCERFAVNSYRSGVSRCRKDLTLPGPFSEERIASIYRAWMQSFTKRRSNKELSFIAYHAGKFTKVFGYGMYLAGFDSALENVKFTGARDLYFTFEDAVKILKTPWRDGSGYSKMWLASNPPVMEEKDVWSYATIHQQGETPGYGTHYGHVCPQITHVEWGGFSMFTIGTHVGYDQHVRSIQETITLFRLENTLRSYATQKALREVGYRESSPDTPP